jgi:hypothetical protein
MGDDDDRVILQFIDREAGLTRRHRASRVVLGSPHGHCVVGQQC